MTRSSEPKLPLRKINPKQFARDLRRALPALRRALAKIDESRKVRPETLHKQITI